jgi:F-type H+-transporting ATPase subunit gamma
MEALEHLQKQLAGLKDLRDIVKTMKALSAASIRQYEHAAEALADYYRTVELGLHAALREAGISAVAELARPPERSGAGLIVFGSDHGLCGRFNEDVVDQVVGYVREVQVLELDEGSPLGSRSGLHPTSSIPGVVALAGEGQGEGLGDRGRYRILAVGARVAGGLEREGLTVEEDLMVPGSAARITATVQQLLLKIDEWRRESGISHVMLFYNHPLRRSASHRPVSLRLLPIDLRRFKHLEEEPWPSRGVPGFTLPRPALLTHLLRQYFFVVISRACADSQAAEHGSRLAAMQAAEKNLADRLDEVTMSYRRARQTAITSELLDVVSGFEAITQTA